MSHPSPHPRRTGARSVALAAVSSLALSGALAGAPVAQAAPTTQAQASSAASTAGSTTLKKRRIPRYPTLNRRTEAGANWVTAQLGAGALMQGAYGADYGLTADAGLALAAVGSRGATVRATSNSLADHIKSYVTGEDFGDVGSTFAGSTAKAAVLAQVAGADARNFGGDDLIARLEGRVTPAGPSAGRISDQSSFGDYANTLGQAFAARALTSANSPRAASATAFLLQQQCPGGYFRLSFTADASATNQSCTAGADAPSTDATAIAVIQLSAQSANPTVAAATDRARAWLRSAQGPDGSLASGGAEGANSNSTGLAGWALGATWHGQRAARWVMAHQAAEAQGPLASQPGAIAYDDAGLAAGRSAGISAATRDQWRRATVQALPSLENLARVTLRRTVVRRGRPDVVRFVGAVPGERVFVRYKGRVIARKQANKAGIARVRFRVGKRPGNFQIRVHTARSGLRSHAWLRVVR